jgi:hypothetical protein
MILSIPKHVSGVHQFPENKLFKSCLHEDLPAVRSKPWLKEGSLSMKKLVLAIRGHKNSRLKDLEMMTEFQHTGTNEAINALHNVYFPKSTSFGPQQSQVRGCLSTIDHNKNVGRKTVMDYDGEKQYTVVSTRDGLVYTAKEVKEPKDTSWRKEICGEVLQVSVPIVANSYYFVSCFPPFSLKTILGSNLSGEFVSVHYFFFRLNN